MSKLLLDEQPLVLLPQLAVVIGLNEAIILQQINYWIKLKEKAQAKDALKEGYYWIYNTYDDWQKQFPFWSTKTIKRAIRNLEESGILVSTDKYNQKKYDKTKWYRIDYDMLEELENTGQKERTQSIENTHRDKMSPGETVENTHGDKLSSSWGQNVPMHRDKLSPPIPETITETTTDIYLSICPNKDMEEKNDRETDVCHKDVNEFKKIIAQCELDHFQNDVRYSSFLQSVQHALADMFFSKELKVSDAVIPQSVVRNAMKRLNYFAIEYALRSYSQVVKERKVRSPQNYLKSCIYNAISEHMLGTYTQVSYNINRGGFDQEERFEAVQNAGKDTKGEARKDEAKEEASILCRYAGTAYEGPLKEIKRVITETSFQAFIETIISIEQKDNTFTFVVPNTFVQDILRTRYESIIKEKFQADHVRIIAAEEKEGLIITEEVNTDYKNEKYLQLKIIS